MSADAGLEQLRSEIAAGHGLAEDAMPFVTGTTVEEIETSAAKLAKLVGVNDGRQERESAVGPFGDLAAMKAQRKAAVLALVSGRTQPREATTGRYATKERGSFDGGARRQPIPTEPVGHDQWLGQVLRERRHDVGAWF